MCQLTNHGLLVANTWALRVVSNGGPTPSVSTIAALANFVASLDAAGVWGKMLDFTFFAPDSLIAALTPAKVTYGSALWTNHGFVAGDLNVNGLTPNGNPGSGKYLDSGININPAFTGANPTVFPGLSVYVFSTNNLDSSQAEMGWLLDKLTFYSSWNGAAFFDCYNTAAGRITVANPNWTGFISGNRLNFASSAIYKAKAAVPFQLIASTNANNTTLAVQDSSIFVFGTNNGGLNQPSQKTLSFAAFHYGLSATECQALFNAVQALRVALGGGFV